MFSFLKGFAVIVVLVLVLVLRLLLGSSFTIAFPFTVLFERLLRVVALMVLSSASVSSLITPLFAPTLLRWVFA